MYYCLFEIYKWSVQQLDIGVCSRVRLLSQQHSAWMARRQLWRISRGKTSRASPLSSTDGLCIPTLLPRQVPTDKSLAVGSYAYVLLQIRAYVEEIYYICQEHVYISKKELMVAFVQRFMRYVETQQMFPPCFESSPVIWLQVSSEGWRDVRAPDYFG